MDDARPEALRQLVRDLIEVLAPYEEELILAEPESPDVVHLRRALGMTIAEASYWITDRAHNRPRSDANSAGAPPAPGSFQARME